MVLGNCHFRKYLNNYYINIAAIPCNVPYQWLTGYPVSLCADIQQELRQQKKQRQQQEKSVFLIFQYCQCGNEWHTLRQPIRLSSPPPRPPRLLNEECKRIIIFFFLICILPCNLLNEKIMTDLLSVRIHQWENFVEEALRYWYFLHQGLSGPRAKLDWTWNWDSSGPRANKVCRPLFYAVNFHRPRLIRLDLVRLSWTGVAWLSGFFAELVNWI